MHNKSYRVIIHRFITGTEHLVLYVILLMIRPRTRLSNGTDPPFFLAYAESLFEQGKQCVRMIVRLKVLSFHFNHFISSDAIGRKKKSSHNKFERIYDEFHRDSILLFDLFHPLMQFMCYLPLKCFSIAVFHHH